MKTSALFLLVVILLLFVLLRAPAQASEKAAATNEKTTVTYLDPGAAEKLVAGKKVVVLDIRTPKEYEAGHIAGAKNIDFNAPDFAKRLEALDRKQPYLVHCAAGGRSTRSLETFRKLEFSWILHLDGGLKAWEKAGKPVTK